jgi:hypothetical protein
VPWTTPHTFATGEIPTAAVLNATIRDDLLALGPQIAGYVNSAGVISGVGFTVSVSGGDYTVTFTTAFSFQPVVVAVPDAYAIFYVNNVSASGFQAHGRTTAAGAQPVGFSFRAGPITT